MADEYTDGGARDLTFALVRHNAALALDIAGLSYENRLRLQQLDEHALEEVGRLMRETAQGIRQATGQSDMATLLNSFSSAQFRITAQLWTHWLEAIASNQQALGTYAAKACTDWAHDLHQSTPNPLPGTGMDAYWANAYANFSRIFQTLSQTSGASPDGREKPSRR
ncbi:hypothetical protein [Bordetella sp. FB-8]|uniref:hypothetical protein n=1 Tax=Bordetella sp. FB-8 TaxID=1159870 RepID=UPI000379C69A|nr:hypothetical protein [Bordetella sp. FB-8]